jgi:hypothetical protein
MDMIEKDPTLMEYYQDHEIVKRPMLPDQMEFVDYLRSQTSATKLQKLTKIKKSTVDHWFRKDKYFSHPTVDQWIQIKPHLEEIKYDKELMTVQVMEWKTKEEMEMWPTPSTQDNEHKNLELNDKGRRVAKTGGESRSLNLADKVQVRKKETFSTPAASQASKPVNRHTPSARAGKHGSTLEQDIGERDPTLIGMRLNPAWVNRLMGYPDGWLSLD